MDPSFTAINGFTSGERSSAKLWLIEEMNEVPIHIRSFQDLERKHNTPDGTPDDTQPSGKNAIFNNVFTARRKMTITLKEILENLLKLNWKSIWLYVKKPTYVTHFFGGRLIVKIFLYWRG